MYKIIINFFKKWNFLFFFLALEFITLFFLFSKSPFHNLIYKGSANFFIGSTYKLYTEIEDYFLLKEINQRLTKENASLKEKLKKNKLKKYFNKELKTIHPKYIEGYIYKSARIINNSTKLKNNFITLDKGENDGIRPKMGVVLSSGIAGIIVKTSPHFSTAISLLNTQIRINVKIKENDYFGFLSWDGKDPRYMILNEIPRHAKISKDYLVQTDGKSAIFPEGISIGKIEDYLLSDQSDDRLLRVKLNFDIATIKEAYIVENLFQKERETLEKEAL